MTVNVAIIGAGVIGCSVALRLYEVLQSNAVVTIISETFSPNTTSNKAGAIIMPFNVTNSDGSVANENNRNIEKWTRESFKLLHDLYNSKEAGVVDVQLVNGYYSEEAAHDATPPWWSDLTPGFRQVGQLEKSQMNIPSCFDIVYAFSTFIINGRKWLPWMMDKIKQQGGSFVQRKIRDLSELNSYDIVINCTGIGSHELVNDRLVYPVHGDVILVNAPWIKQFYFLIGKELYTYIFPRADDVLLGGTGRRDDWSELPDDQSVQALKRRCDEVVPSLEGVNVLQTWAGLRPGRDIVRLEKDSIQTDSPLLIHCYGHGGQGMVLAWGCALDVSNLVLEHVKRSNLTKPKL